MYKFLTNEVEMNAIKKIRNFLFIFVTFIFLLTSSTSFAAGERHELQGSEIEADRLVVEQEVNINS